MKAFGCLKSSVAALFMCGAVFSAPAQEAQTPEINPSTALATVYSEMMRQQLDAFAKQGIEVDPEVFCSVFTKGLTTGSTGISFQDADAFMSNLFEQKQQAANKANEEEQMAFIAQAAAQDGAVTTPSGLVFIVITEGEGPCPDDNSSVSVNYTGRLADGSVFDEQQDDAVTMSVSNLIPGFSEGLKMMKPGGTYRLVIPSDLGYGPRGIPGVIPGNAALDFTVTLDGVVE